MRLRIERGFQSTPSQRGRHRDFFQIYDKLTISIHALAKRATAFITDVEYVNNISIHALAKRATLQKTNTVVIGDISIHALAKRATCRKKSLYSLFRLFQSTPSQRGRPVSALHSDELQDFNPRPRKEGDEC